jgi:molybdopterin-guanine dinucleotide biosynthesis protein B
MNAMPDKKTNLAQPVVIGFYGYSNSGKTSLIERLIRQLKEEGCRLAAVKVSGHAISLDEPGKDTWRYAQAGAGVVVLAAQGETDFMVDAALDPATILRVLQELQALDVIIVEGAKDISIRKIRLGEIDLRENTIWTYDGVYEHLLEKIHTEIQKE